MERPDGLAFLRAVISTDTDPDGTADGPGGPTDTRIPYLAARGAQIQVMLDRAGDRDEAALRFTDVLDGILAPLYLRVLFRVGGIDDTYLTGLVDRLLTSAVR